MSQRSRGGFGKEREKAAAAGFEGIRTSCKCKVSKLVCKMRLEVTRLTGNKFKRLRYAFFFVRHFPCAPDGIVKFKSEMLSGDLMLHVALRQQLRYSVPKWSDRYNVING